MITRAGHDVYALNETHLRNQNGINVPGYKWYGHNGLALDPNALRGSGGIGFLISENRLREYDINVLDISYDGICWIRTQSKSDNELSVILCVCYLPSEGSSRGNNAQEFYDTLLTQTYMFYDGSQVYFLGDYNGRIGSKDDFNNAVESIPKRSVLDNTSNKYGDYLLDFLIDARCCVLNGCGDAEYDNFTSICSHRGRSVVDYMIVPNTQLQNVSDFKVTTMTQCIEQYGIAVSSNVKLPDHSLLSCAVHSTSYGIHYNSDAGLTKTRGKRGLTPAGNGQQVHRRYRTNILPDNMFQNEHPRRCLTSIITALQTGIQDQGDVDAVYDSFVNALHTEMDTCLEYTDVTPGIKSRRRQHEPYWIPTIATIMDKCVRCRNTLLKRRGDCSERNRLRIQFNNKRKTLDKELRRAERIYIATQRANIQNLRCDNPKEFWEAINKLGPNHPQTTHPDSVLMPDGSVSYDPDQVIRQWKEDFQELYQCSIDPDADEVEVLTAMEQRVAAWREDYETAMANHVIPEDEPQRSTHLATMQLNAPHNATRDHERTETCQKRQSCRDW